MRAALPVLTRAHQREDAHPSVGPARRRGAARHAAGRRGTLRARRHRRRRAGVRLPLDEADKARVELLAQARAHDGTRRGGRGRGGARGGRGGRGRDAAHAPRSRLPAPASPRPGRASRSTPRRPAVPVPSGRRRCDSADEDAAGVDVPLPAGEDLPVEDFRARLQARIARHRTRAGPPRAGPAGDALAAGRGRRGGAGRRVGAPGAAGAGRARPAARVRRRAAVAGVRGRARLRRPGAHPRHDRAAARRREAWPVLDRFLELRVPDEITLDADEITSLLEDGVAALRERGIDVLWPRSLGRDLTTRAVLDRAPRAGRDGAPRAPGGPAQRRALRQGRRVHLQLAGRAARRPAHRGGDGRAGARRHPDPQAARQLDGRRPRASRKPRPAPAAAPRQRGRGDRRRAHRRRPAARRRRRGRGGVRSSSAPACVGLSERLRTRSPARAGRAAGGPARDAARLPAPGADLAGRAHLARGGRVPGRRHGPGQDDHADRAAPAPCRGTRRPLRDAGEPGGPTLVVCPASLLGNWEAEIHRFAPGVPVRRFHGGARTLEGLEGGFVLTTYGTMRTSAAELGAVPLGPGRRRRGPAHQERPHLHRPGAAHDRLDRAGRAHRHPGRERPHRALVDPRLDHPRAARQPARVPPGVGRGHRVGHRSGQGAPLRRADRAVPAASAQVRSRHRPRAAGQDRDRPPAVADP